MKTLMFKEVTHPGHRVISDPSLTPDLPPAYASDNETLNP